MKRVLVLNHFAVPSGAAGGTRHTELFTRLTGWSHLIVVAKTGSVQQGFDASAPGFAPVWSVPYSSNNWARILNWVSYGASATLRFAEGKRPDAVYASSPHLLAGLAGFALARRWNVPFVLEIRDLWPQVLVDMGHIDQASPVYRSLKRLESFLYTQADAIVVLAQGTTDYLVDHGVDAQKIVLIPNAADPRDFEVSTDRQELRDHYGFNKRTFIYAGAHGPANGLELLLRAAAVSVEDYDVVLVGDGVDKPELIRCAQALNLPNVRFFDPVPKSEMPQLLAAADVGVHVLADVPLFRYGVSPNKVFDYMAAGLPVLTNTPGGVAELVTAAMAGVAVEPDRLDLGLQQLAQDSTDQLRQYGENGRNFMSTQHSRTEMARRLQTLLDELTT